MATTAKKAPAKKAAAKKAPAKKAPAKAITDAATDLERDVVKALRAELKNLGRMFERIQRDVHDTIGRVEKALDLSPKKAPAKKAAAKKAPAKKK
ncbi:MAG: hypothetical protein U0Q22_14385 [Acidimicrobiales bacterium]